MLVLRFLATVFLLIATIAFVSDATPFLAGARPFHAATMLDYWTQFSPETLTSAQGVFARAAAPWVWTIATAPVAWTPASVFLGLLAAICGYAGRRRHSIQVFAN